MSSQATEPKTSATSVSIRGLRKIILTTLVLSLAVFVIGVLALVHRIFDNFGPAVQMDLEWKATRGARELAQSSVLGLAAGDGATVEAGFSDFRKSSDVVAIVAINPAGQVVAKYGNATESVERLFSGNANVARKTPEYYVGWSSAEIEGASVGRVGIVISTRRLVDSQRLMRQINAIVGTGGAIALLGGIVFVILFTGAIIKRDAQLAEYAATLETKVEQRTAELDERNQGMRLVLDNVEQGFVTVDLAGAMAQEKSAIVERWLGPAGEGESLASYIGKHAPKAAGWMEVGFQQLAENSGVPLDFLLAQMPSRFTLGSRTLRVDYTLITHVTKAPRILVVMTDVTAEVHRERMERDQREMLALFQAISNDRAGFKEFMAEGARLVDEFRSNETTVEVQKRGVHTLKGNASLYGLESMVAICHEIETRMMEDEAPATQTDKEAVEQAWARITTSANNLLGDSANAVVLSQSDVEDLLALIRKGAGRNDLERAVEAWSMEPVRLRFERLGAQARQLAGRLGKPAPLVRIEGNSIRLDPRRWSSFWSTIVHVVRNALDHGIEEAAERQRARKPPQGSLWMSAVVEADSLIIRMRDDGRGIDWQRVAAKAREKGLPHRTQTDLVEALFADGLSTRDEVTLISGRGIGMSAVKEAVEALHGRITVVSEKDMGTTVEFRFPGGEALGSAQAA